MSRKVTINVPVEVTVRDRDMRLLSAVDRLSSGREQSVRVPLAQLSEETEASVYTARRSIRACEEDGYLVVISNCLANGTQQENSYRITEEGSRVLMAARAAGIVS